jgi:hypothetical protein
MEKADLWLAESWLVTPQRHFLTGSRCKQLKTWPDGGSETWRELLGRRIVWIWILTGAYMRLFSWMVGNTMTIPEEDRWLEVWLCLRCEIQ